MNMARRGLSIGFFGLFGRSPELREFDTALRAGVVNDFGLESGD